MFTRKIRWTLAIFFLILVIGIGIREWIILLSLIPIAILIIAYFITTPPQEVNIVVTRELEQTRYQENEHVEITLRIKNVSSKNIEMLEILDELPIQVSLKKGSNHIITSLEAGEETIMRYIISCDYRGRWKLGPTHLRLRNFLDSAYIVATNEETITDFVIMPSFEIIREIPFKTKFPKISDGPFSSKLKGEGLDFSGVREYMPSDSLGRINWPATAKHNKLFTNEYELYRSTDLLLILDATERTPSILDDEIKAVLSLTEHFLKYKCRVGLLIIRDHVDRFELSSSRQQLVKFTEKLIDIQATKVSRYDILSKRLDNNLDQYFPSNCLTIIISPLIHPQINDMFVKVARRRRNSFFLTPSIISSEWRFVAEKDKPANILVSQNLRMRRTTEISRVYQKGVIVLEWDLSIPFSVFMTKLKQVSIRRGRR